jgi:hypothetical protein
VNIGYDIPSGEIPAGTKYQWVRSDIERLKEAAGAGWMVVPWKRHADLYPTAHNEYGGIEVMGLVLVERPQEVDLAEREDARVGQIMLLAMGVFDQGNANDDPRLEAARRTYQDDAYRRAHRSEIRKTAERLCTAIGVSPLRKVMIELPRVCRSEAAPVTFYCVDDMKIVEAWRMFELAAIAEVRRRGAMT